MAIVEEHFVCVWTEFCEETIFDSLQLKKGSREIRWTKAVESGSLNPSCTQEDL